MSGWRVAFSPDGQRAAVGTRDGNIHLLSRDGLKLGAKIAKAHTREGVYELKYDPTGRVLKH